MRWIVPHAHKVKIFWWVLDLVSYWGFSEFLFQTDQELQVTEKTLDVDDVTDKYNRTEIIEMEPEKHESKFILYNHIRKLKWKRTEKVIHHFFRCTSCKKILNINTRTHYATLKRHLNKCCKIELTKGGKLFFYFLRQLN